MLLFMQTMRSRNESSETHPSASNHRWIYVPASLLWTFLYFSSDVIQNNRITLELISENVNCECAIFKEKKHFSIHLPVPVWESGSHLQGYHHWSGCSSGELKLLPLCVSVCAWLLESDIEEHHTNQWDSV